MICITKNKKDRNIRRGFTIMELLVTLSVFALLTTVVLVNFRQVDNSLLLQNVAQQVALVVRKAQISGISVQGINSGGSTVFPSYGVNFDTSLNTVFRLFADLPSGSGNGILNGVACPGAIVLGDECVQRYVMWRGYTIKHLCGNQKTGGILATCSLSRLDISFKRPNPDAIIVGDSTTTFSDGEIILQSRLGKTKTIIIWKTGQISIE